MPIFEEDVESTPMKKLKKKKTHKVEIIPPHHITKRPKSANIKARVRKVNKLAENLLKQS